MLQEKGTANERSLVPKKKKNHWALYILKNDILLLLWNKKGIHKNNKNISKKFYKRWNPFSQGKFLAVSSIVGQKNKSLKVLSNFLYIWFI